VAWWSTVIAGRERSCYLVEASVILKDGVAHCYALMD